jgi:hypothetical protein
MAMFGCRMQLIGCTVKADTVVQMMTRSEVIIAGGSLQATEVIVDNLAGEATVSNAKVIGRPQLGFRSVGGALALVETAVTASTVVDASSGARVTVVGGRLEGSKAAIVASSRATVVLDAAEVVGSTTLSTGAEVLTAAEAAARQAAATKAEALPSSASGEPKPPPSRPARSRSK